MKADFYTKIMLAMICALLAANLLKTPEPVNAQGTYYKLTKIETDSSGNVTKPLGQILGFSCVNSACYALWK
jgi:hypothetical protein